ncbi:MAG: PEGA domain-containing protein [Methanoregula sp.]|nr:PEGA domain-containing protein [Methanoregula sp.]
MPGCRPAPAPNAPSPTPDTTGQIVVVSAPAGAELFLDNTFRGITPVTLSDIPAGSHLVTVKQTGYTDASQTVTVTGGQSTPVAIGLVAVPTTTKTPLSVVPVVGAFAITGIILALGRRKE